MWSLPPKASPISGRLNGVNSFANAIAICRGRAKFRERFFVVAGEPGKLGKKGSLQLSASAVRTQLSAKAVRIAEQEAGAAHQHKTKNSTQPTPGDGKKYNVSPTTNNGNLSR